MIPDSYHEFFSVTAEVAGALIGLLFVAVSVAPERLHIANIDFRIRAGIAFAALTNCLLVTLMATLPNRVLAPAGVAFGVGGLVSCAWLAWVGARHEDLARRWRALIRVVWLAAIFVVQLVACVRLESRPRDSGPVATISYIVLASFAVAIERSWELVGGTGTSVLSHVEQVSSALRSHAHRPDSEPEPPDEEAAPEAIHGDA